MSDYFPTWVLEHTHTHTTPSALRLLSSAGVDTHQLAPSGGVLAGFLEAPRLSTQPTGWCG